MDGKYWHRLEYERPDGRIERMRLPAPFANVVARYILRYSPGRLVSYEGIPYASYKEFMDDWGGTLDIALPNPVVRRYRSTEAMRRAMRKLKYEGGIWTAYAYRERGKPWQVGVPEKYVAKARRVLAGTNPRVGLPDLMDAREARRSMRFS